MNHQEKTVWAELLANFAVLIGYSAWLLGQLGQKDVSLSSKSDRGPNMSPWKDLSSRSAPMLKPASECLGSRV